MTNILGIDPGQKGGMVLLSPSGVVIAHKEIPLDTLKDLDKMRLNDYIKDFKKFGEMHVILERILPFAMSAKSCLTFGRHLGMLEFAFYVEKIPMTLIEAAKWTKEMHQGIDANLKPKVKSSIAVERLFPALNLSFPKNYKKPHEGIVDALLIAEYGRRKLYA